jgi:hypothetical protein
MIWITPLLTDLDRRISTHEVTDKKLLKMVGQAWAMLEKPNEADSIAYFKLLDEIKARAARPTFHFVEHGMRGSVAGVSYSDVFVIDGPYLGKVVKLGRNSGPGKWHYLIARYDETSPPYKTRGDAAYAMYIEFPKRNANNSAYHKHCDVCGGEEKGAGCSQCWAGKRSGT